MAASSSSGAGAEVAIGDKASQPSSFSFPNRKFGEKIPIYRSFQSSWFNGRGSTTTKLTTKPFALSV